MLIWVCWLFIRDFSVAVGLESFQIDVFSESEQSEDELRESIFIGDRRVCFVYLASILVLTSCVSLSLSSVLVLGVVHFDLFELGFWPEGPQASRSLTMPWESNLITLVS